MSGSILTVTLSEHFHEQIVTLPHPNDDVPRQDGALLRGAVGPPPHAPARRGGLPPPQRHHRAPQVSQGLAAGSKQPCFLELAC